MLNLVNAKQCTVLPHITTSVFINDDERGLHGDYEKWLEGLAPTRPSVNTSTTAPARITPTRI
jgi:thiamine phosphate synthase YjbQ (UPF0047 family)